MQRQDSFQIRPATQEDWQPAMDLAWQTFMRFEAKDYSAQGIQNFKDFITGNSLFWMFMEGKYPLFVACDNEQIIGMISLRNENHISLLFVDERYHRRGIGKALMNYVFRFLEEENHCFRATVFAAPYGVGFYHRLGFVDISPEQERDGILYTPMECVFHSLRTRL